MRSAQRRSALVLLGQGGHADGDAGQVEALVVGDLPADLDAGDDAGALDGGDPQGDLAVVDEDRVAARQSPGRPL